MYITESNPEFIMVVQENSLVVQFKLTIIAFKPVLELWDVCLVKIVVLYRRHKIKTPV